MDAGAERISVTMENLKTIFERYNFTAADRERLTSLLPVVEECVDECILRLHRRIHLMGDQEINRLLDEHGSLTRYHREWMLDMFRGRYDRQYFNKLARIGRTHTKFGIRPHYVNVSMNVLRDFLMQLLSAKIEDREHRTRMKESINKMIDINLDIITSSYVEEEIQTLSATYRVRNALVNFAEKFSGAMNLVLVLSLIVITLGVVGLFVYDLAGLFGGSDLSKGIIATLGSLLILWVMIELMNTEIAHLKGGKFNISVFIGVALVTFIRDLMIAALKHEEGAQAYTLIGIMVGVILVLGIVYWLVVRAETRG